MESPTGPSSTPPGAGGESGESARGVAGAGAGVGGQPLRRDPKPPPLLVRLISLCLRPEAWAQTARYPTRVTVIPLLLATLLSAGLVAVSMASAFRASVATSADRFDAQKFPAITLDSDGNLHAAGPMDRPARIDLESATVSLPVLIDPTGKTTTDSVKDPLAILVEGNEAIMLVNGQKLIEQTLPDALRALDIDLPAKGSVAPLDGGSIRAFAAGRSQVFAAVGLSFWLGVAITDGLWCLMTIFFISPLIMLAAAVTLNADGPERRLILPRRAAYRMAAGLLVPLVIVDAVLTAIGHPVAALLGAQGAMIFWFIAAGALAVWTGIMANHMYGPKPRRRA